MNIVVKTASGKYIVRPDTTWERDNEDLYVPEFISGLSYTPVLFARISKPGRSVGEKFADRYYDGIGYGVLLYPEDMLDGSEEGFACASCIDHSSFLPFPVYSKVTLGKPDNVFELLADGKKLFSYSEGTEEMVCKAIAEATRMVYIRTGDVVAIELAPRKPLASRESCQSLRLAATYCGNDTLDVSVIF